eukprot:PhF_6_TR42822/c0_g1_i2/m.64833
MSTPKLGVPPNGTISNKTTILTELDSTIAKTNHPCSVEYLLAQGNAWGNVFGHSAIAYTHPETGERLCMNIVGKTPGTQLVNIVPQSEYLFGLSDLEKCQQGGIYNRSFYGLRIENVNPQDVLAMHYQYVALQHEALAGRASFNIAGGAGVVSLRKYASRVLPFVYRGARLGNCAKWTSMGLVRAGLLPRYSFFPKHMLVRLAQQQPRNNVTLVKYCRVEDALVPCHRVYKHVPAKGPCTVLHWYMSYRWWDLDRFVEYKVEVKDVNTLKAEVVKAPAPEQFPMDVVTRHSNYVTMAMIVLALWYWQYHVTA